MRRWQSAAILLIVAFSLLVACAPQATDAPQGVAATTSPVATSAPAATSLPSAEETLPGEPHSTPFATSPPALRTQPAPLPTDTLDAIFEQRVVELEWPTSMRLGESDIIRIALVPSVFGFTVTTEFPEHQVTTQEVPVPRPGGYDLSAVARLDGVGFEIAPAGDRLQGLPLNERVTWRWTITPRAAGQQRLALSLKLRWTPSAGNTLGTPREATLYDRGLSVQVRSFFGLSAAQALVVGFGGLVVGSGLGLPLAASLVIRPRRRELAIASPNPGLTIEKPSGLALTSDEESLLRTLFRRYARLTLEAEFRSGYSGARTFLALPIHADGRADAHTIAKLGEYESIRREFENYERHVKDTLPPITARIQEVPVAPTAGGRIQAGNGRAGGGAALRYTFIGEPGRPPTSLREALLADPDPALLEKLFNTFGPNWWMQRKPYAFRLAEQYDRLLPAHFVVEPADSDAQPANTFDGQFAPASYTAMKPGDIVALRNLEVVERRPDGKSLSLRGVVQPGHAALRIRWNDVTNPNHRRGRIVATRETLLRDYVAGFELFGLPDPLIRIDALLQERVRGTQSTIHGDLNVENVLVGPGNFLWLIDFAQTRDGHTLFDFAHLEAEIIAHVLAPGAGSPASFMRLLEDAETQPLLSQVHAIALRCLFNPSVPREFTLALTLACLGALKFVNLSRAQKQAMYLTAAHLAQSL